jgi:hypothetical protein
MVDVYCNTPRVCSSPYHSLEQVIHLLTASYFTGSIRCCVFGVEQSIVQDPKPLSDDSAVYHRILHDAKTTWGQMCRSNFVLSP